MKIKSILVGITAVIISTIALAQDPVAYTYSYDLYRTTDGTRIHQGKFIAALNRNNKVSINSLNSSMKAFNVSMVSSGKSYDREGTYDILSLRASSATNNPKEYFNVNDIDDALTFGDGHIFGIAKLIQSDNFYFVSPTGAIYIRPKSTEANLYEEVLSQKGACIGGDINEAFQTMQPSWAINGYLISLKNAEIKDGKSINWTELTEQCTDTREESDIPPGIQCTSWKTISTRAVKLPLCS